jgi:hypothetical protein
MPARTAGGMDAADPSTVYDRPLSCARRARGPRRRCAAGTAPTIRHPVDTSMESAREQNSGSEHSEGAISRILGLRAVVAILAWVSSVMESSYVTMLAMQGRASMRAYTAARWREQPAVRLVLAKSTWESVTRQKIHAARSLITTLRADFRPACVERFTR